MNKPNPDVSIIIPILHSRTIDQTLQSLLNQVTGVSFEIIVVGQDQHNLVRQYSHKQVIFIETEKPTPPGIARNIGVENSTGSTIFFIDADCIAPPDWVSRHLVAHQRTQNSAVVGGGVTFPPSPYLALVDNVSTFHEYMDHLPSEQKRQLPSLNMSLSRGIWDRIGGFNPGYPFPAGEDAEFSTRVLLGGFSLLFEPEAKIFHNHSRNKFSSILLHAFRFGKYSIKGHKTYQKLLNIPPILNNKFVTIVLSPFLAGSVVMKMLFIERLPLNYWKTLPMVILLKIVWCFGYAFKPNWNSDRSYVSAPKKMSKK